MFFSSSNCMEFLSCDWQITLPSSSTCFPPFLVVCCRFSQPHSFWCKNFFFSPPQLCCFTGYNKYHLKCFSLLFTLSPMKTTTSPKETLLYQFLHGNSFVFAQAAAWLVFYNSFGTFLMINLKVTMFSYLKWVVMAICSLWASAYRLQMISI